jgi:uncharacterized protein
VALASSVGYAISGWQLAAPLPGATGYIYWPALAVLMPMTVLLAPVGAKLAHALPVAKLKRVFAALLACLAGYMLTKAA